ncbi:hydantoinase/oxoprolinase family protein [Nocardia fluminea]|uniref:hydantoinase/oxoprolinase family protein n=1 Tax=Nocardia fluminea TaxID=134984 RepID=UPI00366E6F87
MKFRVGVDIGGTFTDCVAIDDKGAVVHGKTPSTHSTSPTDGVITGMGLLAAEVGLDLGEFVHSIDQFSHGTTIGTNLVVERRGGPVGLLVTRGHADALAMMRGRGRTAGVAADLRANVRDTDKPSAIVPRALVGEVIERTTRDGEVLVPLDEDHARTVIHDLVDKGVAAIAVSLIWGFRNPAHEQALKRLVREIAPDLYVSLSSDIAPRQGEFERTVATVINSYVGPASSRYLTELESALASYGLERPPFIMQSNGGVLPVSVAMTKPIQTIGSGPAGGLAGTATIARRSGHANVIATDMGGTSFEVGLLINGRFVLTTENVIDQYTFRVSQLDVRSIACGGGSIAGVDTHGGGLLVGPESAGATPGPACYGLGDKPTVTDADVVLGLIDPDAFLGGAMTLDGERSRAAVGKLAGELGITTEQTAAGILKVNNHNAATLIRQRTIEQGLDPRNFVIYAFGGAGPVHAFGFAEELGISRVVIPMGNGASTLSAYGIAASDVVQVVEQECSLVTPFDVSALRELVRAVEDRARAAMVAAGFEPADIETDCTVLARYEEQMMQEIEFPLPSLSGNDDELAGDLFDRFKEQYGRLYGEAALAVFQAVEIFTLRVTTTIRSGTAEFTADAEPAAGEQSTEPTTRNVYWPSTNEWTETSVYRGTPRLGDRFDGPAIVQLPHTSVSVGPGQHLEVDKAGNAVLIVKESGK